jgi:CheY-like chemotaxis protein
VILRLRRSPLPSQVMKPNILFVAGRASCVQVLKGAARLAHLSPDVCDTAYHAVERLGANNYSALVLDLESPGAENVLRMTHLLPEAERPVIFAMVSPRMHVATAYECGANFVLYKPLQPEQVLRSLRAARGFMPMNRRLDPSNDRSLYRSNDRSKDRRKSARHDVRYLVHFDLPGAVCYPALLLDVNADGMSVQTTGAIPLTKVMPFRMQLAHGQRVRGSAEVIWTDSSGRAGLMFSHLSAQGKQHIVTWLSSHAFASPRMSRTRRKPELAHAAGAAAF